MLILLCLFIECTAYISIQESITSHWRTGKRSVEPYDVTGKNVLELKDISNHQIDVSSLDKGVYIIEIKTQIGLFKEKFVKN